VEGAALLGLPVCGVGEIAAPNRDAGLLRMASGGEADRRFKVLDLSSLWAGPLCGGLLAAAGFEVTKLESRGRPDVMRLASPEMFERLNGAKAQVMLDFTDTADLARLGEQMAQAAVVITSARPRAFEQLGLAPERIFAMNPDLVWVAVTGYGWTGPAAQRVAFGDDAAAAGGLVRRTAHGEPRFLGDALADPLTGLFAASRALQALEMGGGYLVDAGMAPTSARAAAC
jgi:crotonobetainyl-CoA:carnitine CoA-transferase CaiB-like acyl-CoA transferase